MRFKVGDRAVFLGHRVVVTQCSANDWVRVRGRFRPDDNDSGWLKEYDLEDIPALEQLAEVAE